jgi:phospholipase/lecithinase/hemolysin
VTPSIPRVHRLPLLAVAIAAVLSFWPGADLRSAEKADLSRFVVVGDSLAAGYLNDSLLGAQQVGSFASLVAAQAREDLPLPLIAAPGVPNVIVSVDPGPPTIIVRAPGVSTGRVNPTVQAMNLAVPGHTVRDALVTRPSLPIDSLTDLVLGLPGLLAGVSRSQVEWAEALAPSTVLLWLGANDALGSVFAATPLLTPPTAFEADYSAVISRLASTGAALVVGNVPDVTRVPYLTPAQMVAELIGQPLALIGPVLGIGEGDAVTPQGLALAPAVLANPALGPLPANVVLTAAEAQTIRAAIDAYNEIIAARAEQFDATLVDVHALVSDLNDRGYVLNGRRLTTAFLGGLFSLDGAHPSLTGHAIIANEIIKTMNRRTGAGIPPLSISRVAVGDPLVSR